MFNNKFITHNFFTETTLIFKWKLQNNRFTEQKYFLEKYFLEKDYKTKAVEILRQTTICRRQYVNSVN